MSDDKNASETSTKDFTICLKVLRKSKEKSYVEIRGFQPRGYLKMCKASSCFMQFNVLSEVGQLICALCCAVVQQRPF
jgi:hypothetical protein